MSEVIYKTPLWSADHTRVLVSWESTGAVEYSVYRDGVLFAETPETSVSVPADPTAPPLIEVLDDSADIPTAVYPGQRWLCWGGVTGAVRYQIEEYIGSEWIERGEVLGKSRAYLRWRTRFLEDGQEHRFRVIPVDENGITGRAREFKFFVVRHPDPPAVEITYDKATGVLTLAATA